MGEYVSTQTLVIHQLIFLWKSDCLGCAVLLCLVVCLTLLASFFLPSASLINMYIPSVVVIDNETVRASPLNLLTPDSPSPSSSASLPKLLLLLRFLPVSSAWGRGARIETRERRMHLTQTHTKLLNSLSLSLISGVVRNYCMTFELALVWKNGAQGGEPGNEATCT